MTNIVLVGYGKMGRTIESICNNDSFFKKNFNIEKVINSSKELKNMKQCDGIVIDFSSPISIMDNICFYLEKKIKVVVGTTGWYDSLDKVKVKTERLGGSLLYGANFSIGVQLYLNMIEQISKLMKDRLGYSIYIKEMHHGFKKDSPSGTAIKMGDKVHGIFREKKVVHGVQDRGLDKEEINIISGRGGNVIGNHEVVFDGHEDIITLSHHAKNRHGFAKGALECAKWLKNKEGFFSVEDYVKTMGGY